MTKINFANVNPNSIRANSWNTNKMSPANELKLDQSMKRFGGFFKPIIVRETKTGYEIIGGQHRWESSLRLGYEEVPIFNLGPISDDEAKRISIADNARYGADDTLALSELLKELSDENIQDYLPYDDHDLSSIFEADIALKELELDISSEEEEDSIAEERVAKVPKTHTVMRFKISLSDAEKITALIAQIQKDCGFNKSDELTNAGDALVHLLILEK